MRQGGEGGKVIQKGGIPCWRGRTKVQEKTRSENAGRGGREGSAQPGSARLGSALLGSGRLASAPPGSASGQTTTRPWPNLPTQPPRNLKKFTLSCCREIHFEQITQPKGRQPYIYIYIYGRFRFVVKPRSPPQMNLQTSARLATTISIESEGKAAPSVTLVVGRNLLFRLSEDFLKSKSCFDMRHHISTQEPYEDVWGPTRLYGHKCGQICSHLWLWLWLWLLWLWLWLLWLWLWLWLWLCCAVLCCVVPAVALRSAVRLSGQSEDVVHSALASEMGIPPVLVNAKAIKKHAMLVAMDDMALHQAVAKEKAGKATTAARIFPPRNQAAPKKKARR